MGHFKCKSELTTNRLKLTFNVEHDLNEFFISEDCLKISYKGVEEGKERKRDKKKKKKQQKHRILENSNILIPTSDEGTSESLSSSESEPDGRKWLNNRNDKKATFDIPQCCNCAGHHETDVCTVRRGNKYTQYDNVRNKYANDMQSYNNSYRNTSQSYDKFRQY
jgi:hypothetical protein